METPLKHQHNRGNDQNQWFFLLEEPDGFAFAFHFSIVIRTVKLAIPVMLGMLTQTGINLVDTALIGRLPQAVSIPGQAALGVSLLLFWAIGGFLCAIGVGTQAIVARRFGAGKIKDAGATLTNSLIIALVSSIAVSAISFFLIPYVFPLFNRDYEVVKLGVPYSQLRITGMTAMVLTVSFKSFFDGIGKTYVHMIAALLMNVLNFFFAIALVFGMWGFPRMEVQGAALAAVVSSYTGLLIMWMWTLKTGYRKRFSIYKYKNLNFPISKEITLLSLPTGMAIFIAMIGFLLFFKIMSIVDSFSSFEIPGVYSSGSKIIFDILSMSFMACVAFGTAAATLVSQSMGAQKMRLAERCGWEAVKTGVIFIGVLGFATSAFPEVLLRIFTDKAIIIHTASPSLRLIGIFEFALAGGLILAYCFFGAGSTRFVMWVEFFLRFFVFLPLSYLMGVTLGFSILGAWGGGVFYAVGLVLILGFKFREGRWKEIRI